ncbi:hypothetical protein PIROE2DRAFT_1318 [Piromyces sp. E2]|nr:hypothetical protein PIROE2DRAFT_1318 [Piromyces sp. E2]|eukprot:OUM70457.1 hypothetical protein PIROE2DRAFT_1318 [Piromyces sp. E2]
MSFYASNNIYESYGLTDPFGLTYNTLNNNYHNHNSSNGRVKSRHYSLESLFHSFSFFNRNKNNNTENTSSRNAKSKNKKKSNILHMRTLSSPSFSNNVPSSTLNNNDNVNKIELSRCKRMYRYSDLMDNSSIYQPTINVEEKDTQYHISIYLPEVKKDEIKIEMSGDNIFIYGERKRKSNKYANFVRFNRMFTVPSDADCDSIKVKFQNQILEIIFQKK